MPRPSSVRAVIAPYRGDGVATHLCAGTPTGMKRGTPRTIPNVVTRRGIWSPMHVKRPRHRAAPSGIAPTAWHLLWRRLNREKGHRDAAMQVSRWGEVIFFARSFPRICPDCINEFGYCRQAWDLALCVACVRHQRVLIDACSICARALSWNRPTMNACSCGSLWMENTEVGQPSSDELLIAHVIDQRMPDESRAGGWQSPVPPWSSWGRFFNI